MDGAPESAKTTTGAMVIRAWSEPAAVQGFRARLTIMASDGTQESTVAADGEQVVEAVLQWLATFAPAPPDAPAESTDAIG